MYVPWGQELRTKEKEEEARRRRREEDTEVETTTCHDIGRPSKNSLLLQCLRMCVGYALGMRRETVAKTAWVCAGGYAPSPGSNGPSGA